MPEHPFLFVSDVIIMCLGELLQLPSYTTNQSSKHYIKVFQFGMDSTIAQSTMLLYFLQNRYFRTVYVYKWSYTD